MNIGVCVLSVWYWKLKRCVSLAAVVLFTLRLWLVVSGSCWTCWIWMLRQSQSRECYAPCLVWGLLRDTRARRLCRLLRTFERHQVPISCSLVYRQVNNVSIQEIAKILENDNLFMRLIVAVLRLIKSYSSHPKMFCKFKITLHQARKSPILEEGA